LLRIAGLRAEIWSKDILNTKLKCYTLDRGAGIG
jgi:hypothetical protein